MRHRPAHDDIICFSGAEDIVNVLARERLLQTDLQSAARIEVTGDAVVNARGIWFGTYADSGAATAHATVTNGYGELLLTGGSLYIRPLLIGTSPEVGVKPSDEYLLLMFVTPVGPYFKDGFKPVDMMISRNYDRAAPQGTGTVKVGGNYAASLLSLAEAKKLGYSSTIYLDAKEKKYIDECGPANFFGIKGKTYVTPKSESILPSITNKSLQQLAEYLGYTVERRQVPFEELAEFSETAECGTAAVITPIKKIVDPVAGKEFTYGDGVNPGPVCTELFTKYTAIQFGEAPDPFGWTEVVDI